MMRTESSELDNHKGDFTRLKRRFVDIIEDPGSYSIYIKRLPT